jgi:hypothetical protein
VHAQSLYLPTASSQSSTNHCAGAVARLWRDLAQDLQQPPDGVERNHGQRHVAAQHAGRQRRQPLQQPPLPRARRASGKEAPIRMLRGPAIGVRANAAAHARYRQHIVQLVRAHLVLCAVKQKNFPPLG